jgi:hypothetical protein
MADGIQDTVPNVLKTLWNLENDLRSAAQNGVILRGEDARNHLQQARFHLDQLLGLAKGASTTAQVDSSPASSGATNSNDN